MNKITTIAKKVMDTFMLIWAFCIGVILCAIVAMYGLNVYNQSDDKREIAKCQETVMSIDSVPADAKVSWIELCETHLSK